MVVEIVKKVARRLALTVFSLWESLAGRIAYLSMLTPLALKRVTARGIEIATVIDVGASDGRWSVDSRHYFPGARFHLIEANPYHEKGLRENVKKHRNFSYVLAAAGPAVGKTYFDNSNPFGGQARQKRSSEATEIEVPMTTIDHEVIKNKLPKPYLLKFDTHGFEIPILEGAKDVLKDANLLVIEVYNFDIGEKSVRFYDMCSFMDQIGFRVIDISEPLWRLKDRSFWQMDFLFVKKGRPEFDSNKYR